MGQFFTKYALKLKKTFSCYFSLLLTSLILIFVFRPGDRGPIYKTIWELLFVFVFFSAIFNCNHSKKVKIASAFFGVPGIILHWIFTWHPHPEIQIPFLVFILIFIIITTFSIIKRVILNTRVTLDMIRGVICAYFMFAFGFSFAYVLINALVPGTFHFENFDPTQMSHGHFLSVMMYYSFVTLLTIGYGDISAIKDIGQTVTILEGIIGQFYIAILVARLVAVYAFFEHNLHLLLQKKQKK